MLERSKQFYREHKIFATLSVLIVLPLSSLLLYSLFVIIKANLDTPKVVEQATQAEWLALRLEDFSDDEQRILLAVEDPNFYSHNGVDLTTAGAGWTTITQGIVKIYFYNGFTPGRFRYRKFEQTLIALVFDKKVDKKTQLLVFINSAYFGEDNGKEVIGFEAAAETYFHKRFSELTRDEYVSLVAMLIGPNGFNVIKQASQNRERVNRINRLLSGECKPAGHGDVYYDACG